MHRQSHPGGSLATAGFEPCKQVRLNEDRRSEAAGAFCERGIDARPDANHDKVGLGVWRQRMLYEHVEQASFVDHAGVEPLGPIRLRHDRRHSVVQRLHGWHSGFGHNQAGLDDLTVGRNPAVPQASQGQRTTVSATNVIRKLRTSFTSPLVEAICKHQPASCPKSAPKGGLFSQRFDAQIDRLARHFLVSRPRRNQTPWKHIDRGRRTVWERANDHDPLARCNIVAGSNVELGSMPGDAKLGEDPRRVRHRDATAHDVRA